MTDEQKQNRLNLIGSLVAGITAAAGGEAAVAANAAQIETGNNYLGTGLNLFGYQLGENQVKAFVEDIQDTCSSGPSQACVDTYNQWKETSYKQGGLETTEDREGWESLVHAAYEENVLPLCKGDLFCEINVNARMKLDTVMYAGDAVGLKDSVESVTRATNIANGNWVRLGLQVVGDVGLVTSIGGMVGGSAKATGEVATTVPRTPLAGPTGNWKNYTHAEAVIQTQASGRLVNAEKVVIDPNKVTSYALNTTHPVGGNKAKVFESALGYNQTNAASLIAKVQEGAKLYPAKLGASDKFGQRITIDMPITGPNGNTATVRTGWIYDPGSATPRMTTLYVK